MTFTVATLLWLEKLLPFSLFKTFTEYEGTVRLVREETRLHLSLIHSQLNLEFDLESIQAGIEPLDVVVPLGPLVTTLKALQTPEVHLHQQGTSLTLRTQQGSYTLSGSAPQGFPVTWGGGPGTELTVDTLLLESQLSYVAPFVSTDELRPALTAVLLDPVDETYSKAVATDAYRLVMTQLPAALPFRLMLPPLAIKTIALVNRFATSPIRVESNERWLRLTGERFRVVVNLIEEKYPDYKRVLPTLEPTVRLKVTPAEWLRTLKCAEAYSQKSNPVVVLHLTEGLLTFTCGDEELAKSFQEKHLVDYHGPELIQGFNIRYLRELLASFPGQQMLFNSSSEAKLATFLDEERPTYYALLMAVRISTPTLSS